MTNTDKMYIPNVNQWTRYYQNVVSGQSNAYVNHMKSGYNKGSQSGSFMIPISNKSYPIRAEKENNFVVRLVSPSEQIVNQAKEEIKIDDENVVIKLCKIRPNPAIIVAHSEALKTTNAKYPSQNYDEKFYNHARKHLVNRRKCFPRCETEKYCARIGFFNCYVWSIYKNPFNFMNYDLKQVTLFVTEYQLMAYHSNLISTRIVVQRTFLLCKNVRNTRKVDVGYGNEITRAEFNNGYTLLCFNLEPFFGYQISFTTEAGKIRLECQFGTPLPETAALLILAENYGYFEITENRQIKD
ncbi:unnamed protein product [Mytilus edulis]|uniref:Uncharacterized protein n=1 Tax=Mytilus edulis TaxID=6550 RepID=A0A8S3UZJ8_MYTED|nr:unnamed protein product [Mytilus edulis]